MREVEDKDLGFRAMRKAAMKIDGLELRMGILDHRLRYPAKGGKGQFIAKVAGIHKIHAMIAAGYDAQRSTIDAGTNQVLAAIHNGAQHPAQEIYNRIGKPVRESMRKRIYQTLRRQTGRMAEAVRATVFEEGCIGSKSAAYRGTVAAGDNPSLPKASTAVS